MVIKYKVIYIVIAFIFLMLNVSACAHYRIVRLYEIVPTSKDLPKKTFVAVAKNNVIVPEFVIDKNGRYPTTEEEAWERFYQRQLSIEDDIDKKYSIPHSFPYQIQRIGLMIGLSAVSPVVIPITYMSDTFSKTKVSYARDEEGSRLWRTVKGYFSLTATDPVFYHPHLKDEFKIVTIQHE